MPKSSVAIIGAGPAGLYAAAKLAAADIFVALLNRDVKPGGLAEYGIYFDKYKMKEGLRQQFRKILSHPNITYYGNVTVGSQADLSLKELQEMGFQALLVTVGAQGTKWLGLPGEFLAGVYHAKDIVYHYNKLPPYSHRSFEIGRRVALIGVGNVMVDIARWLIHIHQVEEVIALARRGPAEVKFTRKEMETVACNLDFEALEAEFQRVAPIMQAVNQNIEQAKEYILSTLPSTCPTGSSTRLMLKFLSAPSAILDDGSGRVCGLEVDETSLMLREDGSVIAKPSGHKRLEHVDTVIFCIGDRVDESLGLPVKWNEYVLNPKPHFPIDGNSYEAFDPQTNAPMKGVFIAGWARKASEGLVGIARKDGENAAQAVLGFLNTLTPENNPQQSLSLLEKRLTSLSKPIMTYPFLLQLDQKEKQEAELRNTPFFAFESNEEMFAAVGLLKPFLARLILPQDVEDWAKLRRKLWHNCTAEQNEREIAAIQANPNSYAVLVSPKADGGLQGFLEISIRSQAEGCKSKQIGYIEGVYVIPTARQKGVAKALIAAAEDWARQQGCREMATDVEVENLLSQYVHKRLGFYEVERHIHFVKPINPSSDA
mgnify:CR=1 FL=1